MPQRVLFVCLGNACRSQMAEGFARVYGSDVMEVASAGLTPIMKVPQETIQTMAEKNVDVSKHFPKSFAVFPKNHFDIVINMSGFSVPGHPHARDWDVEDPFNGTDEEYRATRDHIEHLVMKLIMELRRGKR